MKHIAFLSGTRADWGKIKPLIAQIKEHQDFSYKIFVCGMHLLKEYGLTHREIIKDGFEHVFLAHTATASMDIALSQTITHFHHFIQEYQPDLIVVHGDRLEALAGAIVGAFNNIKVAHIEGGEISGTIDESIRHSITKLAHIHFSANQQATQRLIQLGENPNFIFEIGSPDIDIMLHENLPDLNKVAKHYQIDFILKDQPYAIAIYHPVTTRLENLKEEITNYIQALILSQKNYVVIYPNNDAGSHIIINALQTLKDHQHFAIYPSLKFEKFLTLLKHASFIIGNSSAGIREAPIYHVPTINIGSRQQNRSMAASIMHVNDDTQEILQAIINIKPIKEEHEHFGKGNAARQFLEILQDQKIWNLDIQKKFFCP